MNLGAINPISNFGASAFKPNYAGFMNQETQVEEFATVFMTQLLRQSLGPENNNALYGNNTNMGTQFLTDYLLDQVAQELVHNQTLGWYNFNK